MKSMKSKVMVSLYWIAGLALSAAALFGYKCPAQGCPACKMVGK
jgi:hypothetical protein